MPVTLSAKELLRARLYAQRLIGTRAVTPAQTVRHMLALQGQDFAQGLWAIGVRSPGSARTDVLAALASGEIVRTLPMRGTLHFVASEDLGWMLRVTSARMLQSVGTRFSGMGLDGDTLREVAGIVERELTGGGSATRDEFTRLVEAHGISTGSDRAYNMIFHLCQIGLVCWGPPRGTQQALVLVDEWIPHPRVLTGDEALREFALRYFRGHGPATLKDFTWWNKLTLKDARAGIEAASDELTRLVCGDTEYWAATSELDATAASTARPRLLALPGFDEYLLGYQDRSLALDEGDFQRIVPGGNGIFLPLIVADGRVVGTWRRAKNGVEIEPDHFLEATKTRQAAFAREARAYAAFATG